MQPRRAVFYPFALFSPEWQAIHYGARRNGIPVRFMDLPQAYQLASWRRSRGAELRQQADAQHDIERR